MAVLRSPMWLRVGDIRRSWVLAQGRVVHPALVGIVALAIIARVGSALYQGDTVSPLPGIYDQISYDALARRVLTGYGFTFPVDWWPATRAGEPTAHWSFLYTLYLAAVYALFGPHPLVARLIQAVVASILQPWLSYRIGRRLFGTRIGVVAAALSAVYPYFVYYASALMTETFYILAILWSLDLATGSIRSLVERPPVLPRSRTAIIGTKRPWILLGLALGVAALLRQLILLFVPFLFIWIVWIAISQRSMRWAVGTINLLKPAATGLLVSVLVLFAMIVPWTVRNYEAFGRFVPLNTNSGYAFFWGNHPIYGTDFVPILPGNLYYELIPADLRILDEAALDQALLKEGVGFVLEDPGRVMLLSASRIKYYFQFWPSPESSVVSNLMRLLSFGILLPLTIYGLFLSTVQGRQYALSGQRLAIALLCLFTAVYSLIHILSWALIRYRLPIDGLLILFAALAITDLRTRLAGGPLRRVLRTADLPKPGVNLP